MHACIKSGSIMNPMLPSSVSTLPETLPPCVMAEFIQPFSTGCNSERQIKWTHVVCLQEIRALTWEARTMKAAIWLLHEDAVHKGHVPGQQCHEAEVAEGRQVLQHLCRVVTLLPGVSRRGECL